MVVLVAGGNGQLGQSLQFVSKKFPEISFYFYSSNELNITDIEEIKKKFQQIKPDFCINAAAYTAVDKAESEIDKAHLINVLGSKNIAQICDDFNTTLIHISTDFVFDGKKQSPYLETDLTHPENVYGKTKLEGEVEISKVLKEHFIIRTSWLYSQFGNNFMKTMLRLAREKDSLSIVNDQIGTPTNAVDLAEVLIKIILSQSNHYGIYHYSNEGNTSWYDFAKKIFEINSVSIKVNPIPTVDFPTPAKRPKYSVLDKSKIKSEFKIDIKNWADSIKKLN